MFWNALVTLLKSTRSLRNWFLAMIISVMININHHQFQNSFFSTKVFSLDICQCSVIYMRIFLYLFYIFPDQTLIQTFTFNFSNIDRPSGFFSGNPRTRKRQTTNIKSPNWGHYLLLMIIRNATVATGLKPGCERRRGECVSLNGWMQPQRKW